MATATAGPWPFQSARGLREERAGPGGEDWPVRVCCGSRLRPHPSSLWVLVGPPPSLAPGGGQAQRRVRAKLTAAN